MKTSFVKSINSTFKGIHKMPTTLLVMSAYYKLGALFANKGSKWSFVLESSQIFMKNCMNMMKEETHKFNTYQIIRFDRKSIVKY